MVTKRFSLRPNLIVIGGAALLLLGIWIASFSSASTVGQPQPFYSPIQPIGNPELELTKSVDDANPTSGDEIVYTLSYANTNPGARAFNVRLFEFLPAGVQFLSANPAPSTVAGGALVFEAPSVGPTTASVDVQVRVRVLEGHEYLQNHALVTADGVVPVHASLATNVTQPSRWLRLTKTGYSAALTGAPIVYTLMCQNTSDTTVNDVKLVDVLPPDLTLVSASLPPEETMSPLLSWSLGDLGPGERRTVVITTTAPASAHVVTNTALADARQRVVTQTVFATQVISQGAILHLSKAGSAPRVNVGDELVYRLNYENAGNQVATDVRLTDTFPSDINVTAVSVPALSLTDQRGVWELGTLNPGEAGKILITTTVAGTGDRTLLNVADITGQAESFPGHAELETEVSDYLLYMPIAIKQQ